MGLVSPTAHASLALLALTELRLALTPREGVGVSDQALPFQW